MLAAARGIEENRVNPNTEDGQENVHDQAGENATGNRRGVMQSAQSVSIHWVPLKREPEGRLAGHNSRSKRRARIPF